MKQLSNAEIEAYKFLGELASNRPSEVDVLLARLQERFGRTE